MKYKNIAVGLHKKLSIFVRSMEKAIKSAPASWSGTEGTVVQEVAWKANGTWPKHIQLY